MSTAFTLQQEGKWEEAVQQFSRIIAIFPQFAPAHVYRGLLVQEMGMPDKALKDFEHAITLNPNYGMAYYGRGWVRHIKGDFEGELTDAMHGLELDSSNQGAYYRRIGSALAGLQRYVEAIDYYNKAIKLHNGQDAGTILNRGLAHEALNKLDEAIQDYSLCLELSPNWNWALVYRAKIYITKKEYKSAFADCDQAIKHGRYYISAYLYRGIASQNLGKLDEARQDYNKVLADASATSWEKSTAKKLINSLPKKRWFFG
jgi:tetratricopeptide (TPR) repeat protein